MGNSTCEKNADEKEKEEDTEQEHNRPARTIRRQLHT